MKTSEFELGDFVTNGVFVRELISYEGDRIYYLDYVLDDGTVIPL